MNNKRLIGIFELKERMSSEFKEQVEEYCKKSNWKSNKWQRDNPEKQQQCNRNYSKTEKGKKALKRRDSTRHKRYRDSSDKLTHNELEQIKQFYCDCPHTHEVDHVIPISKGGLHHISNLQYLPKNINRKKKDKHPDDLKNEDWYKPYIK